VALLLPNIYKSTAVFYPTNPESTDPDRFVTPEGNKLESSGRPEDLDRVITIGTSQPVAEHIIRKFKLHEKYKMGKLGDELADQATLEEFNSNLKIVHTERDAIELTFQDRDKHLAARIANELVSVIDSFNQQLTLDTRRQVLNLYRDRYEFVSKEYAHTRKTLLEGRRRFGIYGMDRESRYLAKEIVETENDLRRAEASGDAGKAATLRRSLAGLTRADGGNLMNLENYVVGTDSVSTLYARFTDLQTRLINSRAAFENAELALKGHISSLYIVQKAYPAARKAKPIRWLIVASSVLITLVLSIILITLLELFRRSAGRQDEEEAYTPVRAHSNSL
jgi:capsular polysaccharide biosynthesis protein